VTAAVHLDLAAVGASGAEGWREVMARTYIPFDARPAPGRFEAGATRVPLGPFALVQTEYGRGTGQRGRAEIGATVGDPMGILVLRRGRLALTLGDRNLVVHPGEALLWDGGRPGAFEALEPVMKTTLIVSRERLRAVLPCYEAVLGRVLPADSATVRLLGGYLDIVAPLAPSMDGAAGEAAGATALELARVALGSGDRLDRAATRSALVAEILRHIDRRLGDPSMSPATIAMAHAVSVRTLHALFAESGTSVAATIRERRLARCHADLGAEPATPVGVIGARWGFHDPAHFSRAFRRRYGMTPRELQHA
jgi:AraC-like DNA-binding protein